MHIAGSNIGLVFIGVVGIIVGLIATIFVVNSETGERVSAPTAYSVTKFSAQKPDQTASNASQSLPNEVALEIEQKNSNEAQKPKRNNATVKQNRCKTIRLNRIQDIAAENERHKTELREQENYRPVTAWLNPELRTYKQSQEDKLHQQTLQSIRVSYRETLKDMDCSNR